MDPSTHISLISHTGNSNCHIVSLIFKDGWNASCKAENQQAANGSAQFVSFDASLSLSLSQTLTLISVIANLKLNWCKFGSISELILKRDRVECVESRRIGLKGMMRWTSSSYHPACAWSDTVKQRVWAPVDCITSRQVPRLGGNKITVTQQKLQGHLMKHTCTLVCKTGVWLVQHTHI